MLNYNASEELYKRLYNTGLRNKELILAFLHTYETYREEATIFAHEGRHSLGKKYFPYEFDNSSNAECEYHAKLSQLIFAIEPRYELSGMIVSVGNSGHGLANQMIVDILTDWKIKNGQKINGYLYQKSPLSQIYLLTGEEIKTCAKQADPLNYTKR
jgi:hypothetical protein